METNARLTADTCGHPRIHVTRRQMRLWNTKRRELIETTRSLAAEDGLSESAAMLRTVIARIDALIVPDRHALDCGTGSAP